MNRILKQRFNQISRQNSYLFITRSAAHQKVESPTIKVMPARPMLRAEPAATDVRRV